MIRVAACARTPRYCNVGHLHERLRQHRAGDCLILASGMQNVSVGVGTRIEDLARVAPDAIIGQHCHILQHASIGSDVMVGDRVTIRPGAYLGDGARLEDDVYIDSNATLAEANMPNVSAGRTFIKCGAYIGANSTISPGITVGQGARVLPGAVVTRNVPPLAIVSGNPAVISGYKGADHDREREQSRVPERPGSRGTRVSGVTVYRLASAADMRGQLAFGEVYRQVPFEVKRFFLVYGVPNMEVRGEHAHHKLHQFIICVHGRCSLMADDGAAREEIVLDDPTIGVHLPPLIWGVQYKHTPDAVQLVLASDYYQASDYIRDYQEFLDVINSHRST